VSDARWLEVDDDVRSSIKHFANAVAIFGEGVSSGDDLPSYTSRMAFMQAMQAGKDESSSVKTRALDGRQPRRGQFPNRRGGFLDRLRRNTKLDGFAQPHEHPIRARGAHDRGKIRAAPDAHPNRGARESLAQAPHRVANARRPAMIEINQADRVESFRVG
jgi:hypothetical protein